MQIYDFPEGNFFAISVKLKISFTLTCYLFRYNFWLGLDLKTPANKKRQPKWVVTVLRWNVWVKKWVVSRDFWMISSGLRTKYRMQFLFFSF